MLMLEKSEYMTAKEAQEALQLSSARMARYMKNGELRWFSWPRDRRVKLIRREDVERLREQLEHPEPGA